MFPGDHENKKNNSINLINITSTTSELTKEQVPGSQLNFCLLNARSVNNKTLEIKDYSIDKDVDLFAITESWLKADESSDFVSRDRHRIDMAFCTVQGQMELAEA